MNIFTYTLSLLHNLQPMIRFLRQEMKYNEIIRTCSKKWRDKKYIENMVWNTGLYKPHRRRAFFHEF